MDFFDRVATCVDFGMCNKEIIDTFFLKAGQIFFRKYYPYVCDLRAKWRDNTIWSVTELYFNPVGVGRICN
jgi:hypothetical protein